MKTTEYLDLLKRGLKLDSDYALAQRMNWSTARLSGYRHRRTFDDMTAVQVAIVLMLPPHKVLADMQAERAKEGPLKKIWNEVADQLEKTAARAIVTAYVMAGALATIIYAPKAEATITLSQCILCQLTGDRVRLRMTKTGLPLVLTSRRHCGPALCMSIPRRRWRRRRNVTPVPSRAACASAAGSAARKPSAPPAPRG